jgi:hypothetical protein
MNERSGRQGPPRHTRPDGSTTARHCAERVAIVRAVEALEVGDPEEAIAVLLSVLEDGPVMRSFECPHCPSSFEWPGLLRHHLDVAHWEAQAA